MRLRDGSCLPSWASRASVGVFAVLLAAAGCDNNSNPDSGVRIDGDLPWADGGGPDSGMPPTDGGGGEIDAGPRPDAGPPPTTGSEPSPPARVESMGTAGFLLRGTVLAPTSVLDPGEVLIVGDTIRCVAADCSGEAGASDATVIDTQSVISPGLIDGHNHLTYDFLPEWVAGITYDNRYTWADEAAYEDHISPFADGRNQNDRICPAVKWGELRSIIHGTTTVMGQSFNRSCIDRLARNADHFHHIGYDHMRTSIGSVRDINDETAATIVAGFMEASEPTTRFAVHMQEGIGGGNLLSEFDSFAGRDTRSNRHMGTSLLSGPGYSGVGMLIHSMGLTSAQLDEAASTGASVIWSPSSNLILYGETAPIADILSRDITVGLGPDWTVSGEDDMLSEMRVASDYARAEGIAALTTARIWEMATQGSADAVGLAGALGVLEVGARADVSVFGRRSMDPYQAVLDSRAQDVRLVFIDGQAYYGDMALEGAAALNGDCEMLDACGALKFLCVANTPGAMNDSARPTETMDDIHSQLTSILAMYGRESDLLPLVACE
ncbi:MAG: amidohydrolase family protein [Sandaracinaceae bacterium]